MSTEIHVDDETRAALLLFNERVEATAARERGAKRVAKAERAKDEAATRVRKVGENPNASAEEKAEAEDAYKAAVAEYNTIKADPLAGEQPRKPKAEATPAEDDSAPAEAEDPAADDDSAPAEAKAEAPAENVVEEPTEVSADEEDDAKAPTEAAADSPTDSEE